MPGSQLVFGFGYDALSRRTQLTRPNGLITNYTYDGLSHLLSVLHQTSSTARATATTTLATGQATPITSVGSRRIMATTQFTNC
jgi:YD repeat-containing protein